MDRNRNKNLKDGGIDMGRDIIAYLDDKEVDLERDQELFDYLQERCNIGLKKTAPESVKFSYELSYDNEDGSIRKPYWINLPELRTWLKPCEPLLGDNWRKLISSEGKTLYFWFGS
jgi:hypothetical protein